MENTHENIGPLSAFSEGKITLNLAMGSQLVAGFFAWGVQPSAKCLETTIHLHLLFRCLEEVPKKYSPLNDGERW